MEHICRYRGSNVSIKNRKSFLRWSYLTEERVQVACFQTQCVYECRISLVQFCEDLIVVGLCDAAVGKLERIQQRQDVSGKKKNGFPVQWFRRLQHWTLRCVITVLPGDTAVESLCGPEANDGVDDGGRVHGGEAVDGGDDQCILLTVITSGKSDKALGLLRFRSP